jgi:hypothetical protein
MVGLLSAAAISVGTAIMLRPRPRIITVAARALTPPAELDSLRRRADSLDQAIAQAAARLSGRAPLPSAIRIGEPSLVAFLPDSAGLDLEVAALRRQFQATLPRAARVAADPRFVSGLISHDHQRAFVIGNIALVTFGLYCFLGPVRRQWPSAVPLAWLWVVIELANGISHPLWSLAQLRYTPGVATAPLLLALALYLAQQLLAGRASPSAAA